jgi:hypothetical protein
MKVYIAIKKELDWGGCYYEGDIPGMDVEYKVFATEKEANKFKLLQKDSYQWEVEEQEVIK